MTSLEDKAQNVRDVVRASGLENQPYRIESTELVACDEITDEGEFPQYGDFLDAVAVDGDGDDLGERWVECPADLAAGIVGQDLGEGDCFQVVDAAKADGNWSFDVEAFDA